MSTSLSSLPNELILIIARFLDCQRAINSLVRTCRHFYHLLLGYLFRYNGENHGFDSIYKLADGGNLGVLRQLLLEDRGRSPHVCLLLTII